MIQDLETYDWSEVFHYGGKPDSCQKHDHIKSVIVSDALETGFDREDVTNIIAMVEGQNDGPDWIGVFKLKDGRYVSIVAGCDYTGWD